MGNFNPLFSTVKYHLKNVAFFLFRLMHLEIFNPTVFKFCRKVRIVVFKSDYTALSSYVTEKEKSNCLICQP